MRSHKLGVETQIQQLDYFKFCGNFTLTHPLTISSLVYIRLSRSGTTAQKYRKNGEGNQ